jgi:folate-binding Fe-S cluster repair protein YgfZ
VTVIAGFCQLKDHAVVKVSGTAARGFLSRQLTCDLASLSPSSALFGAWLTPR